ncbi:MAG: GntR family transcriptional regulator [Cetobacterium sp.]|uniref:GntR family transcriptional regulator n=1 Tax=Cetobacterium sp. TaxID=2071632 RepID=UPI003F3ECCEE
MIDKSSTTPLYLQLVEIILEQIKSGTYNEGEKIPSERELSETFSISRATVRQALSELEKQKDIYKIHGKGNFVSTHKINQDLNGFYSFSDEMIKLGKIPGNKILNLILKEAGNIIATKLNIHPNDKIFILNRVRLADNEALMYETTYLPQWRFEEISENDIELNGLYNLMKNKYNVSISYAEESFSPCILNENDSLFLNAVPGDCGMILERYTFEKNSVIEYTKSIVKGNSFKYKVRLNNFI